MIKLGNLKEEQEKNISREYTLKQWKKAEQEAIDLIDKLFDRKLEDTLKVKI